MALDNPKITANMVTEYQASGIPYVTESVVASGVTKFQFPFVTREFTVRNNGVADVFVGFSENGALGTNGFTLSTDASYSGPLRIKNLFVSASAATSVTVIGALTRIPWHMFPVLTGSDGFEGIG